jgi:hypothetical protein
MRIRNRALVIAQEVVIARRFMVCPHTQAGNAERSGFEPDRA